MKFNKTFLIFVFFFVLVTIHPLSIFSQESDLSLRPPFNLNGSKEVEGSIPSDIEFDNIPNFPKKTSSQKRISVNPKIIPVDSRLRLSVDSFINPKTSMAGDYFKAHVLEDFYLCTELPQLVIPRGSWIRGRVSFVKKPSIFAKSGKLKLRLDKLITPLGEIYLIDSELLIQQGVVNDKGLLDPILGTAVEKNNKQVLNSLSDINQYKQATTSLTSDIVRYLLNGSLITLIASNDSSTLSRGQEVQLVLKKDIQL